MGVVEEYAELERASGALFRTAHEATLSLTARIEELESELYVWKNAMREQRNELDLANKTLKEISGGEPIVSFSF